MKFIKQESSIVQSENIGEGTKIWHFAHIRESAVIGKNCNIGNGVYIDKDVIIGSNVKIQNYVNIYKGVTIEDDVFVGPSVTFTNDLYPRAFQWRDEDLVKTYIKKGASIGANATIVCGVTIGKFALIAAGSVITKDVPDHALMIGTPAKQQGYVCFCGRTLKNIIETKDNIVIYKCKFCKKKIDIKK